MVICVIFVYRPICYRPGLVHMTRECVYIYECIFNCVFNQFWLCTCYMDVFISTSSEWHRLWYMIVTYRWLFLCGIDSWLWFVDETRFILLFIFNLVISRIWQGKLITYQQGCTYQKWLWKPFIQAQNDCRSHIHI